MIDCSFFRFDFQDSFNALIELREEIDKYLAHDYPTEVFAWHDLAGDVQAMTTELERRLLSERCKLIIKRQLTIVDEWERRLIRWQEYLKPPGHNVEKLGLEFDLHVVQERIFDQFLELSKQLQQCLERLQVFFLYKFQFIHSQKFRNFESWSLGFFMPFFLQPLSVDQSINQ